MIGRLRDRSLMGELKGSSSICFRAHEGHNDRRTHWRVAQRDIAQRLACSTRAARSDEVLPCRVLSFDLKQNLDLH